MESVSKIMICVSFVVVSLLIVVFVMFLNGGIPVSKDTHPPCEQLPTVADVTVALAENQDLAKQIQSIGNDIVVEVGKPCTDAKERGLVLVSYGSKVDRDAIANLLSRSKGFGVPVHLEKR